MTTEVKKNHKKIYNRTEFLNSIHGVKEPSRKTMMLISRYILNVLDEKDWTMHFLAERVGLNYRTLIYRLYNGHLTAYDLINISMVLSLDLFNFEMIYVSEM